MTEVNKIIEGVCRDWYNPGEFLHEIESMSRPDLVKFMAEIKKLEHHKVTTVGLWATDVFKDEYNQPNSVMFQILY